jgi:hypothetical protein
MRKLLCSICILCLLAAMLAGCGAPKSTAAPEPSATPAVTPAPTAIPQSAAPTSSAAPTASPEPGSDLAGSIASKNGVFLISKDLFVSQLDLVLTSFGYRTLPDPVTPTGEPTGKTVKSETYDVGAGVTLTLCTGKNGENLSEIDLTATGVLSGNSFSDYQKCCVDMIDFDRSKSILGSLEKSKSGTTAIYSENASYILRVSDDITTLRIIPKN